MNILHSKENLEQNLVTQAQKTQYRGYLINLQKQYSRSIWGIGMAGYLGSGDAATIDINSPQIVYLEKTKWSLLGAGFLAYYRLSKPISLGLNGTIYSLQQNWENKDFISVQSTQKIFFILFAETQFFITDNMHVSQALGFSANGSTAWKIGLSYKID